MYVSYQGAQLVSVEVIGKPSEDNRVLSCLDINRIHYNLRVTSVSGHVTPCHDHLHSLLLYLYSLSRGDVAHLPW